MFLYADMTSPSLKENQQATLVSEILQPLSTNGVFCVTFSYYKDGDGKFQYISNNCEISIEFLRWDNFNVIST